ncbi:TIM barrel protein [Segetibacter sp.]|jgi:hypothetical protein|uniref:sugar phosphate isomerase/epimerase family protein n=1 Tax=Segetibacter sp. TaxID=2231182 RepID=UPI00260FC776|nr:TIM barrel protein [Segetibacter sp.]MCW3078644.1 hypothetical protein [Segetibacter sp.]
MKLLFFCPRWGQELIPWSTFLKNVQDAGYDGIEGSLSMDESEKEEMLTGLKSHGLYWIGQHWETVNPVFNEHLEEFEMRLRSLAAAKPLFINSQTGKDYFSPEENKQLIDLAKIVSQETGVRILHETHRGKFSFAAHITKAYLQNIADLKITLDISHWFNTAETYLHDQEEAVELAISRTEHIHSRVGFIEGPQITDPRAPEWSEALQRHLECWDKVIELQQKNNREVFTITSEFGAPPYMPLLPYTKQPIVDQWEVNVYMMNLLRDRYKN